MKVIRKQIKTAPAVDPVSLASVKNYLKIDLDDAAENNLLNTLLKGAWKAVEKYTGRALATQTWYGYPDKFPCSDEEPIELPMPPLVSVTSIKHYDYNDVLSTITDTEYYTDLTDNRGRIFMKYNYSWPTTQLRRSSPIIIEYICGYGITEAEMPSELVEAVLQTVAYRYENRESAQTNTVSVFTPEIQNKLAPFMLVRL